MQFSPYDSLIPLGFAL